MRNYRKDGKIFWNQLSIAHVRDPEGVVVALVGIQSDVTHERRRDESIAEAQRLEALGTMAGNIAHEINNWIQPTLVARDLIGLYLPGKIDHRVHAHLDRLAQSGEQIRTIVRDVLAFARGEQGHSAVSRTDLTAAMRNAVEFVASSTPPTVSIVLTIDRLASVDADITQTGISQIVTNLCVNSIRAMEGKGVVEIRLGDQELDVNEASRLDLPPGAYFLILISDNGPGVQPEIGQRIFEPFFSSNRLSGGTGLGLSVVRGILLSWGGNIELEESYRKGARFRVYIPRPAL